MGLQKNAFIESALQHAGTPELFKSISLGMREDSSIHGREGCMLSYYHWEGDLKLRATHGHAQGRR